LNILQSLAFDFFDRSISTLLLEPHYYFIIILVLSNPSFVKLLNFYLIPSYSPYLFF